MRVLEEKSLTYHQRRGQDCSQTIPVLGIVAVAPLEGNLRERQELCQKPCQLEWRAKMCQEGTDGAKAQCSQTSLYFSVTNSPSNVIRAPGLGKV